MDVTCWKTPAAFLPWMHVRRYIDGIDSTVYRVAIELAQEQFLADAQPCPAGYANLYEELGRRVGLEVVQVVGSSKLDEKPPRSA